MLIKLSVLFALSALAAFWFEGRHVQEIAIARCREACRAAGLMFLDDIAPIYRWHLARDAQGRLRLRRRYRFDYSLPTGERRSGYIVMLGRIPLVLELEGQRVIDSGQQ